MSSSFLNWLQGNDATEAPPSYFARNQVVGGPSRAQSVRDTEATISPTAPTPENGPMPTAPFLSEFLGGGGDQRAELLEDEEDEDYEYYSDSDDESYDEDLEPPLPPLPHAYSPQLQHSPQQQSASLTTPLLQPSPRYSRDGVPRPSTDGLAPPPYQIDANLPNVPSPPARNDSLMPPPANGAAAMAALTAQQQYQQQQQHQQQQQQQQQHQRQHAARGSQSSEQRRLRRQKSQLRRSPSSRAPQGRRTRKNEAAPKQKHIPKALKDPKVRKQLLALKQHKPFFLWIVTAIQVVVMIAELGKNLTGTGQLIETNPFNYMIGPGFQPLVTFGGRWVPCMKDVGYSEFPCQPGYTSDLANGNCTLATLCGLQHFEPYQQNQWYRFILPIFLHGGIVHLLMNMMFQIRTGWQMERDWGFLRMFFIYMLCGTYGFIFGANFSPSLQVSVGCSGSLYGLFACLVLDLFMNWRLIENPWKEFLWMIPSLVFSFGIGYVPLIDNFAHVGGFLCGIFAGLLFMPTIHYGRWDRIIKIIVRLMCIPILIIMFYFTLKAFYQGNAAETCPWCKYLSCAPIFGRTC